MAYPEYLIQRAIQLSPGRSAGEILRALKREFKDTDLPDERTIRRWCKDKSVTYIEENKISQNVLENWKEHNKELLSVVEGLLANDIDSVLGSSKPTEPNNTRYIITNRTNGETYELNKDNLSEQIWLNHKQTTTKYTKWFFYICFQPHLEAELPELKDEGFYGFVEDKPIELINTLRILAARKTFKGTCPVCKDWK
jgi:hypothetical protein